MTDDELERLGEFVREIRTKAYAEGYQAALDEIVRAAQQTSTAQFVGTDSSTPKPKAELKHDDDRPKRARRGEVEEVLSQVLSHGRTMTVPEIETAAVELGSALKTPTIRVALQRMEQAGKVEKSGRNWSLVRSPDEVVQATQREPHTNGEIDHDDGVESGEANKTSGHEGTGVFGDRTGGIGETMPVNEPSHADHERTESGNSMFRFGRDRGDS